MLAFKKVKKIWNENRRRSKIRVSKLSKGRSLPRLKTLLPVTDKDNTILLYAFIERQHQTDDYEFYIPYLMKVKSELQFIKLGQCWKKVYNTLRPHMELKGFTPYQKLKSLRYFTPEEFCLFPTLISSRLVNLLEMLNHPKSVQDHIDYDPLLGSFVTFHPRRSIFLEIETQVNPDKLGLDIIDPVYAVYVKTMVASFKLIGI